MINIHRVSVRNIRSIPDATIEPDPAGITSITGPIGSGKSTLLTAVVWCLYGEVGGITGLLTQADMRRKGATAPARVTVEFSCGNTRFTARRELRRGKNGKETAHAELSIDGVKQPSISPTKLTQQVEKHTGLTGRAYCGAAFIAQGNLPAIADGTPTEVQRLIEEQTGLAPLTKKVAQARAEARDAAIRAEATPGTIEQVNAAQIEVDTAQAAAAERWPLLEDASAELERATTTEDTLRARNEELAAQAAAAHAADLAKARAEQDVTNATRRLQEIRAALRSSGQDTAATDIAATEQSAQALQAAIEKVATLTETTRREQDSLTGAADALHQAQKALTNAPEPETERARLVTAVDDAKATAATSRAEWTRLTKAIAQLDDAAALHRCPTCTQHLSDPAGLRDTLRQQVEHVTTTGKSAAAQTAQMQQQLDDHDRQQQKHTAAAAAHQQATEQHQEARARYADAEAALTAAHQALLAHLPNPAKVDTDGIADTARSHLRRLDDQLTTARRVRDLHEQEAAASAAHARAQQALRATREVPAPSSDVLRAAAHDLAQAQRHARSALEKHSAIKNDIDVLTERARAAEASRDHQQQLLDRASTAAEQAETKQHAHRMLDQLRRELVAEYTATISAAATDLILAVDGVTHTGITIGDDFVPRVVLPDGQTRPMRVLSGGEKMRAALCLRLGIAEQISNAGTNGMIFADEITANHDDATTAAVIEMLRSLQRPIVIVAHATQVHDIATRTYQVHKADEETGATVTHLAPALGALTPA